MLPLWRVQQRWWLQVRPLPKWLELRWCLWRCLWRCWQLQWLLPLWRVQPRWWLQVRPLPMCLKRPLPKLLWPVLRW